jgi:Ethanolamine utilization protein EutJ (predicted chaperonin)
MVDILEESFQSKSDRKHKSFNLENLRPVYNKNGEIYRRICGSKMSGRKT